MTSAPMFILRIGLGLTFILTGWLILKDDDKWTHMLPKWFSSYLSSARSFMIVTAIGNLVLGSFLLSGYYMTLIASLCSIHLLGVLIVSGREEFHEVYRDIGLLFGCVALLIYSIT